MVLWLPFDETSGPISANLAANAGYGSQVGNPTPVIGAFVANSLHFNGVNQYVTVPNYTALEIGSNDLTIDAWVNRATNGPDSLPSVIVDKRNPADDVGYSLALSFGHLVFQMSGQNYADTGSLIVPPDGQWHFIAVRMSQSQAADAYPARCSRSWNSQVLLAPGDHSLAGAEPEFGEGLSPRSDVDARPQAARSEASASVSWATLAPVPSSWPGGFSKGVRLPIKPWSRYSRRARSSRPPAASAAEADSAASAFAH